jgi:hypothetical protein
VTKSIALKMQMKATRWVMIGKLIMVMAAPEPDMEELGVHGASLYLPQRDSRGQLLL